MLEVADHSGTLATHMTRLIQEVNDNQAMSSWYHSMALKSTGREREVAASHAHTFMLRAEFAAKELRVLRKKQIMERQMRISEFANTQLALA